MVKTIFCSKIKFVTINFYETGYSLKGSADKVGLLVEKGEGLRVSREGLRVCRVGSRISWEG